MQNQSPLFLPYDQLRDLLIIRKYDKIFDLLDLSEIKAACHGHEEINLRVGTVIRGRLTVAK